MDTFKVLLMGLDGAGKSSIINSYFEGMNFEPIPNDLVEEREFEFFGNMISIVELGGRYRFKYEWPSLYNNSNGFIWVLDSIDRGRITESKEELVSALSHPDIIGIPILIIANKQDSKWIMPWEEIEKRFSNLGSNMKIIKTSAFTCENIEEGLQWLIEAMKTPIH